MVPSGATTLNSAWLGAAAASSSSAVGARNLPDIDLMRAIYPGTAIDSSDSLVPQQRRDTWFTAAEGLEAVDRVATAPDFEDLAAKASSGVAVEQTALLERAVCVGRQHLGPLVAVVA